MKRTQIYITDEQDRLVGSRALELGVSKAEVIRGTSRHDRGPARLDPVARLFSAVTTLDVTDLIAKRAGAWVRRYRASHPGIDLVDYLIAASAAEHHARLVTLNVKHFPMFAQLRAPWRG